MPIRRTSSGGKPAYQWGDTGKKYTYKPNDVASREAAKKKAIKQGLAAAYQMKTKPDL